MAKTDPTARAAVTSTMGERRAPVDPRDITLPPVKDDFQMRVRAKKVGYYAERRIRIGDVFTIYDPALFSKRWMVEVPLETPETITTSPAALKRIQAQIKSGQISIGMITDDDPLPDRGARNPLGEDE